MCRAPSGISSGGMIETSSQPSPVLRSRVGVAHDRLQASGERPATAVGPGMVWVKQVDRVTSRPARPSGISTDCHDVASVRTSPYRRRVIGPGVVPASLVDDLGGSPKCIRACRLDLRGSYRVFTLCKELGTAAAAREAYVEYMILHHTPI